MNFLGINKLSKSTLIMITVPVGAYYERSEEMGVAHFLEHMCFKGSKNYKKGEIDSFIENIGGDLNAYTDWELTSYYAIVENKYIKKTTNMLLDMVLNPCLDKKEIEKERNVIIQEKKMYEDDSSTAADELLNKLIYANRFKESIVGTDKTLKNINQDILQRFHKEHYNKKNIYIITIGDVSNQGNIFIDEQFRINEWDYFNNKSQYKLYEYRKAQQANIVLGGEALIDGIIDSAQKIKILNAIYNDMSGRLFKEIREKQGMVYGIHFDYTERTNGTIEWKVSLGLDKKNIDKAINLITKELIKPISEEELKNAIRKISGEKALIYDNTRSLANSLNYKLRLGKNIYYKEQNISINDINIFKSRMRFDKHNIGGIIPK